jgi:hypothetical protein
MGDLAGMLRGNPVTAPISIVAPNLAHWWYTPDFQKLGDLSADVDYGDMHGGEAFGGDGVPLYYNVMPDNAMVVAPRKVLVNTESGYSTQQPMTDPNFEPTTEKFQAVYDIRAYFQNFSRGALLTDIYQLVPAGDSFSSQEAILHSDLSPKPAYNAIKAVTTLLADTVDFPPHQLTYTIAGGNSDTNTLLLEKSDGTFWLAVWQDVPVWNGSRQMPVSQKPVWMKLHLASPSSGVIYIPNDHGTTPVSTFSNTVTVSFNSLPEVTLIKITQ